MRVPVRPTLASLVAALGLATGLLLGTGTLGPHVVLACSCVAPMPLAGYAGEGTVIFAGMVTNSDEDGLLVDVDQWFSGTGAAPVILIAGDFGNGSSCGIGMRPPAGSSWLVVGGRVDDGGLVPELTGAPVMVSICSPFVDLATPEGQALLDEAVATFGGDEPGSTASAPSPSAASAAPVPSPSVAPSDGGLSTETLAAAGIVATLLAGIAVLAIVLLVAGRRGSDGSTPAG